MANTYPTLAIAYDFDGTLAPGNMQERDFIPAIGMTTSEFWTEVAEQAKIHNADNILVYMRLMLQKAEAAQVSVRESDLKEFGKGLAFFQGVEDWFERVDAYGKEHGVRIEHYVISSGIREMVAGTSISKKFKKVYASSFIYDHHGVAKWPALVLNYTTKTQYLFRINKGTLDVYDHKIVNDYVPKQERPVPFENMVFLGDGETDIPCFRLVKDQGGHSIAVYQPSKRGAKKRPEELLSQGRVNFIAAADYRDGKILDKLMKAIINKVSATAALQSLGEKG